MRFIAITTILLTLVSCSAAQREKALNDSRAALDKACEVRAAEKSMINDAGAHD